MAAAKSGPSQAGLVDALAKASWIEADTALAEALCHFEELEGARGVRRRALFDLLGQALTRAARRRGFKRVGELGAIEPYDPKAHDLRGARRRTQSVAVVTRGVARGGEVLSKPRVRPLE